MHPFACDSLSVSAYTIMRKKTFDHVHIFDDAEPLGENIYEKI